VEQVTSALRAAPSWDLVVALARLDRATRVVEHRATLGTADLRLLWLLANEGACTMKEIAQLLTLEQSTVNRQVNAALRAGLVETVERPGEPARAFAPSEEGMRLFSEDVTRSTGVLEGALTTVPADEVDRFVEHLRAFAEAYRRLADEAVAEAVAEG